MAEDWTKFPPVPAPARAVRLPKATLIGVLGPPGSGKTRTVLRLMRGVQRVFPGPSVLIDTEAGRSSLYAPRDGSPANPDDPAEPTYDFHRIDLGAPFRGDRCWAAIQAALALRPAAVGFDNISDEHTGEGGYLDWHDREVERVGGNDWGAWARPAAGRKKLISGICHVAPPPILFFTFIAEEKTDQIEVRDERTGRNKKKVINKGWTPIAPLLILKSLDLTCILPWDSKGTPIWESRNLPYEDFIRKWPDQLTRLMLPGQITEDHGEALARWAKGDTPAIAQKQAQESRSAPEATTPAAARDRDQKDPSSARDSLLAEIRELLASLPQDRRQTEVQLAFGVPSWSGIRSLDEPALAVGLQAFRRNLDPAAVMAEEPPAEREPGEDGGGA